MTSSVQSLMPHAPRVFFAALLALFTLPALAQTEAPPITATDAGLTVDLAGHRLTVPPPAWSVPSSEPVAQAQTRYTLLAPGIESLVLLPIGTTVVTWTELMGILAVNRPGYSADAQLASVVDPITQACSAGQLQASTVGTQEEGAILLLCGRYRPAAEVPHRCGGGIILASVLESPQGAAKIYHEWCTSSFDVEDTANWPVSSEDLTAYAELLIAIGDFTPLTPGVVGN